MATTLFLRDYLLRPLQNATPGTTDPALDPLGREVQAGDIDFIGRALVSTVWAATTAYAAGDYVDLSTGEALKATEGGTSDAAEPTAPGHGESVVDGTVTWEQVTS